MSLVKVVKFFEMEGMDCGLMSVFCDMSIMWEYGDWIDECVGFDKLFCLICCDI